MLPGALLEELNEQIKYELFSANYYLSMAAYCASEGLDGFANFFFVQDQEERFHAMKFFHFILEKGERPVIKGLEEPRKDFSSLEEVFELALKHEKFVSKRIYDLMELATKEKEFATISFLKWFVDEQVEEEASMSNILSKISRVGEKGEGIYTLDRDLAQRVFTPPAEG